MWDVASSDILAWRQNGARWSGPEDLRGPIINGGMDVIGDGDEQTLQAILGEYKRFITFVLYYNTIETASRTVRDDWQAWQPRECRESLTFAIYLVVCVVQIRSVASRSSCVDLKRPDTVNRVFSCFSF